MLVLGTAGHIDHGKSALVKALTGIDPDRLPEERQRGMTIDLGFAWLELPSGREVSIVDVPGHERFIKNMLAGVGGISMALLVIAADSPAPSRALAGMVMHSTSVRRGHAACRAKALTLRRQEASGEDVAPELTKLTNSPRSRVATLSCRYMQ